ncbi:MAG: flagellin lysine-N-methylase [Clostridia bacterium]|nr:flagellin lysine-N-methylase [Clostridia bacterium]
MERHEFRMPDYYPGFACKMGACRNACCTGWPVSLSLADYFRITGAECSAELREKIDRGVQTVLEPTPERYASMRHDYSGNCYLRMEDGRCALHAQLGENVLADVCRLYPRGVRKEADGLEISCANSCEAVIEAFLEREAPLTFLTRTEELRLPPHAERKVFFETHGHQWEVRHSLIRTMQDRTMSIPERLAALKARLEELTRAMESGEEAVLGWLNAPRTGTPERNAAIDRESMRRGLALAERFIERLDERSDAVRAYGETALGVFGSADENALERYLAAERKFEAALPLWETVFEHMLVNHMFFICFPFEDRPEDLKNEFTALCVVYSLLRFLAVGNAEACTSSRDFADLFAAVFRLVEHTSFDILSVRLLEELGAVHDAGADPLLSL